MSQKKKDSISDRQLREALGSLRQDVAAPPDFRAKVLKRLAAEGLIQAAPKLTKASWLEQLRAWATPLRLSLAASAALAVALTLRFLPGSMAPAALPIQPQTQVAAASSARAASSALAQSGGAVPKGFKRLRGSQGSEVQVAQSSKPETLPEAIPDKTQAVSESEATGSESTAPSQSSSRSNVSAPQLSSASLPSTGAGVPLPGGGSLSPAGADPKPTVVVLSPTPTPGDHPLQGNSELRGNVIRASRGEAALLLYRVDQPGHVRAEIFDRLGHSIAVLKDADQSPGVYQLPWAGQSENGTLAPSGIMVLDLQAPGYHAQHKLLLVK
jgi:hypothetical protein